MFFAIFFCGVEACLFISHCRYRINLHGCDEQSIPIKSMSQDYTAKLPQHDAVVYDDIRFSLNNIASSTRTLSGKEYKIVASNDEMDITMISYLFIDKIDGGYLLEHYTEDKRLIASIRCNENLMIEDIFIESLPETRGLRFWWVCTQARYNEMRKYRETEGGMWMDIANDWLPMSTISAIASGLYCMGTK